MPTSTHTALSLRAVIKWMLWMPFLLATCGMADDATPLATLQKVKIKIPIDVMTGVGACADATDAQKAYECFVTNSRSEARFQAFDTQLRALAVFTCKELKVEPCEASFIFAFPDKFDHATTVLRAVTSGGPSSYKSTRLAGRRLFSVAIQPEQANVDYVTTATYVPLPNPLVSSLSKVIGKITEAAGKATAKYGSTPPPPPLPAEVLEFDVSDFDRATITLADGITSPVKASLTTKFTYGPLIWGEFGLGSGVIGPINWNQAAKLDSGTKALVDDSPSGLLTWLALNWHPLPYDETSRKPSFNERFRILFGVTLTPKPGLLTGVGYAPFSSVRSISVQGGYAVMLANIVRNGDTLGSPPADAGNPTKRGALGAWFIGLGYAFQ